LSLFSYLDNYIKNLYSTILKILKILPKGYGLPKSRGLSHKTIPKEKYIWTKLFPGYSKFINHPAFDWSISTDGTEAHIRMKKTKDILPSPPKVKIEKKKKKKKKRPQRLSTNDVDEDETNHNKGKTMEEIHDEIREEVEEVASFNQAL